MFTDFNKIPGFFVQSVLRDTAKLSIIHDANIGTPSQQILVDTTSTGEDITSILSTISSFDFIDEGGQEMILFTASNHDEDSNGMIYKFDIFKVNAAGSTADTLLP